MTKTAWDNARSYGAKERILKEIPKLTAEDREVVLRALGAVDCTKVEDDREPIAPGDYRYYETPRG